MKPGFRITGHKGFQVTFPNGVTVSVQFGPGNYCGHYPDMGDWSEPANAREWESGDAEIALFNTDGDWLTKEACLDLTGEEAGDDVLGYQKPEDVLKYLKWAQERKP